MIQVGSARQEPNSHSNIKANRKFVLTKKMQQSGMQLLLAGLMGWVYLPTPVIAQALSEPTAPSINATPPQVDAGYLLGAGDRVRVDIFNVPEYSGEFLVLSDGTVNLPLVGTVAVGGLTLQQASSAISAQMAQFLRRPIVTLSLTQVRPLKVAIAGEVNRPGTYTFSLNGDREVAIPTITRAIELAGGITQTANLRQVQVRRSPARNVQGNSVVTVDLWELLKTGDINQDLLLRDGDSIFIPTATALDLDEMSQMANSSLTSDEERSLNIGVVGEVKRPGPYTLTSNQTTNIATVTRALQAAGGITPTANIRTIQVRRPTNTGSDRTIDVDLWKLLEEGDLRQDLSLQDGDTVVVAMATEVSPDEATELAATSFSPEKISINVVGEAVRPGTIEVAPNTPLAQGLLAAGGFNNQAKKSSVELIRLNPNGTIARRQVTVDFSRPLNEENNPGLRNNDTIIIGRSRAARFADAVSPIFSVFGTVGGILSLPEALRSFGTRLFRIVDF